MNKLSHIQDVIDFGKYKGHTVGDVIEHDAQYLKWLMENTDRTDFNMKMIDEIEWAAELQIADYYYDKYEGLGWGDFIT